MSLAGAEIITKILGFVLYTLIARYLGPDDFGIYSVAVSFSMIFALVGSLGVDSYLVKEIAKDPNRSQELLSTAALVKGVGGVIGFCSLLLISTLLNYEVRTHAAIVIFGFVLLSRPLNELMGAVFRGLQRMEFSALMKISRSALTFSIVVVMILLHRSVLYITSANVFTSILLFIVFYFFVLRRLIPGFRIDINRERMGTIVCGGFPFLIIGMMYIINAKTDVLMLSKLASIEKVGIYDAGNQLLLILLVIPSLVSQVIYPLLAEKADSRRQDVSQTVNFVIKVMVTLSVPISVGIVLLAPAIIELIYGNRYVGSAAVLQILGMGISVVFIRSVLGWALAAIEKVKLVMWINFMTLTVNIVLNLVLIPLYMERGAAMASICSMVFATICMLMAIKLNIKTKPVSLQFVKPVLSAAVMGAFLMQFPDMNLFLKIPCGVVLYLVPFVLLKGFTREEYSILKRLSFR